MLRLSLSRRVSNITLGSRAIFVCDRKSLGQHSRRYARKTTWKAPETRQHQGNTKTRILSQEETERRLNMQVGNTDDKKTWNDFAEQIYIEGHQYVIDICKKAALPPLLGLQNLHKTLISFDQRYRKHFPTDRLSAAYDLRWFYETNFQPIRLAFEGVQLEELYQAGRHLYHGDAGYRTSAATLLLCCAREGHAGATIFMAHLFLRLDRGRSKNTSRKPALSTVEGIALVNRLTTIADSGNFRAKVLRGLLASHYGYKQDGLKYYRDALPNAVYFSKQKIDPGKTPFLASEQRDELSSPWVHLALAARAANDEEALKEAFKVGTQLDDPEIWYQRAMHERRVRGQRLAEERRVSLDDIWRNVPYSLNWLQYMTKAAASGHTMASFYMADYYANAPAEPRPSDADRTTSPFKLAIQLWRAFDAAPPRADPEKDMEYYASLLQDPQQRIEMAMYWLRVCASYGYVQALLRMAHLHINKFIYPVKNVTIFIEHPDEQTPRDHKKDDESARETEDGIDNPYYSPRLAHDCLAMALYMVTITQNAKTNKDLGTLRWFPEVVAEFEKEALQSDNGEPSELETEICQIADRCGIDIQDCWGKVRYAHQGEKASKRGKGIFEFGKVEVVMGFPNYLIPGRQDNIEGNWRTLRVKRPGVAAAGGK